MTMIQSLGVNYCREWIAGSLINAQGRPALIRDFGANGASIAYLDSQGGIGSLPASFFTGFAVLAYPELGYRRVGNFAFHVHRQQGARRGLNPSSLTFEDTPMSAALNYDLREGGSRRRINTSIPTNEQRLAQVMCPTYDTRASLDLLVAGRLGAVVPSEDVCIEPDMDSSNYVVMYRNKVVGHMTPAKRFVIQNPAVAAAVSSAFRS